MTLEQIAAHVGRLDELAKELVPVRKAEDPLLYVERKADRDT
jgi:hypothetical protein